MAKKETKRGAPVRRARPGRAKAAPATARKSGGKSSGSKRAGAGARSRQGSGAGAADALKALLESPLVADILAAGAAAALATIAQRGFSRRQDGGSSKAALKNAAMAAASAMGARIAEEVDEIMKRSKHAKSEKA